MRTELGCRWQGNALWAGTLLLLAAFEALAAAGIATAGNIGAPARTIAGINAGAVALIAD